MIKIAVCDDDEKILGETLELLRHYKKLSLTADAYTSGEALLAAGKKYDILLLDIDMEGPDGIETARRIREVDKEVKLIYVTNYSDYTIFAFGVHAFAYLLKPLKAEELFAQLDEALAYGLAGPEPELEFLAKEGIVHIVPSRILCFEYLSRQVLMYTEERVWHLKRQITELAREMEGYGFAMPHKSFVVNLYAVQRIHGYEITLTDGMIIPLSQKKSAGFRRALNEYLAGERGQAAWKS
ncbi:MAG: response regulator transcription factor [Lachnospiraceae bacterium]|nr:response regulator transcription factor [Lachnospiraceae bacterium]